MRGQFEGLKKTPVSPSVIDCPCPSRTCISSTKASRSSSSRYRSNNFCALVLFVCINVIGATPVAPPPSFWPVRGGATTSLTSAKTVASSPTPGTGSSNINTSNKSRRPPASAISTTSMLETDESPSLLSAPPKPGPSPSTAANSTTAASSGPILFGDRILLSPSRRRETASASGGAMPASFSRVPTGTGRPGRSPKPPSSPLPPPASAPSPPSSTVASPSFSLHHSHRKHVPVGEEEEGSVTALDLAMADIQKPTPVLLAEGPAFVFEFISQCELPTDRGLFHLRAYRYTHKTGRRQVVEPVVLFQGEHRGGKQVWVRVHDQCLTSEVLGSRRCDCKEQLEMALDRIVGNGSEGGLVIYLPQEGRGIGLANKVAAYALQEQGLDTVDANLFLGFGDDERTYDYVSFILQDLGIESIRLATNNPFKTRSLRAAGVQVDGVDGLQPSANRHNLHYLRTKILKMEHAMELRLGGGEGREGEREEGGSLDGTEAATTPEVLTESDRNSLSSEKERILDQEGLEEELEEEREEGGRRGNGEGSVEDKVGAGVSAGTLARSEGPQTGEAGEKAAKAAAAAAAAAAEAEKKLQAPGYCFGKATVEAAINAVAAGKMVVVVDDEDRENEGDIIMAADKVTTEAMAFIVRHCSGVVCVSLEGEDLDRLALPPMIAENEDPKHTAFTVSVDYKHNTTTGISAHDRAATLRALADPASRASDFTRPGHIFPLRYSPGGVRNRRGHTEAALDLSKLAGRRPVGVLCEICSEDGSMARLPELREFCARHNLVLTSIADLVAYRVEHEGS